MKLLYRTAEWHALAKLRMHTESSLALLDSLTTEFGLLMQNFKELTCSQFVTTELPGEADARECVELDDSAVGPSQSGIGQAAISDHRTTGCLENITTPMPASNSHRKH